MSTLPITLLRFPPREQCCPNVLDASDGNICIEPYNPSARSYNVEINFIRVVPWATLVPGIRTSHQSVDWLNRPSQKMLPWDTCRRYLRCSTLDSLTSSTFSLVFRIREYWYDGYVAERLAKTAQTRQVQMHHDTFDLLDQISVWTYDPGSRRHATVTECRKEPAYDFPNFCLHHCCVNN